MWIRIQQLELMRIRIRIRNPACWPPLHTPLSRFYRACEFGSLKLPVDVSSILTQSTFQKDGLCDVEKIKKWNGSLQINLGGKPKVMFPPSMTLNQLAKKVSRSPFRHNTQRGCRYGYAWTRIRGKSWIRIKKSEAAEVQNGAVEGLGARNRGVEAQNGALLSL